MTIRRLAAIAAAAAALAAPPALAFDGTAVVGGGYSQTDSWAGGAKDRFPVWNWMGGGSFHAAPLSPGLFQLDGSFQYDAVRNTELHAPSNSNGWTFRGSTLLLGDWVPIAAFASRGISDFSVDTGATQTGSTLNTSYGGNVKQQIGSGPLLEANASRTEQNTRPLTGQEYHQIENRAGVQASQSLNTFDYKLDYQTTWSTGLFADTNYQQHGIAFSGGADLSKEDRVQLTATYSLREPSVQAPTNPRFDTELLQGTAMLGTQSTWSGFASYSYSHSLVDAFQSIALEQTNHTASYTATNRYSSELLLNATASASYGIVRADGDSLRTTGEQVGAGATWTRGEAGGFQLQLGGSTSVGALQAAGGADLPGYGFGFTGGVRDAWRLWSGAANYQVNFAKNLGAVEGTSLAQTLNLTADTRKLAGVAFGARVTFNSTRRDVVLLGTSMDRSILAALSAAWRRLRGEVSAGTSDGLAATLRSPGFSDGLFLTPAFNTHNRYATAQLAQAFTRSLTVSLLGRYLDTTAPDRPMQHEVSGSVLVGYDIGQFTFRFEDRLTQGGTDGNFARTNLLFARVERRFDVRF